MVPAAKANIQTLNFIKLISVGVTLQCDLLAHTRQFIL